MLDWEFCIANLRGGKVWWLYPPPSQLFKTLARNPGDPPVLVNKYSDMTDPGKRLHDLVNGCAMPPTESEIWMRKINNRKVYQLPQC